MYHRAVNCLLELTYSTVWHARHVVNADLCPTGRPESFCGHPGSVGKASFNQILYSATVHDNMTQDGTCQERAVSIFDVLRIKPQRPSGGKAQSTTRSLQGEKSGQRSSTNSDFSRRPLMSVSFVRSTASLSIVPGVCCSFLT